MSKRTTQKEQIELLIQANKEILERLQKSEENSAKLLTQLNERDRRRANPNRVYQCSKGSKAAYWGTITLENDFKKGQEVSVTLFDAPNSNKTSAEFPQGKQAYGVSVRPHTPQAPKNDDISQPEYPSDEGVRNPIDEREEIQRDDTMATTHINGGEVA